MPTCLVIDESDVVRKVVDRILSKLGVSVEQARTGAEAFERLAALAPDVVIVSTSLADMAADEFVRGARAKANGRAAVILPMFVEANLGQMTRLKRAGATGFVYKPFNRASLLRWLEPHLALDAAA